MKDMLDIIYEAMVGNEAIKENCSGRIKYYIYPETGDTSKPFITIRPLQPPQDANFASDISLGREFFYQIDVQSNERKKCKEIQRAVKSVMLKLGFYQRPGGLDEYFEETKRYVDARRYFATTKPYDTDY